MSKLDRELALRSAALNQQRRRLQLRKKALRHEAMAFCKRPTTLACAALTGFALARISPLAYGAMLKSPAVGPGTAASGGPVNTLRVVLLSLAPTLLRQAITAGFSARERANQGDAQSRDREAQAQACSRQSQ